MMKLMFERMPTRQVYSPRVELTEVESSRSAQDPPNSVLTLGRHRWLGATSHTVQAHFPFHGPPARSAGFVCSFEHSTSRIELIPRSRLATTIRIYQRQAAAAATLPHKCLLPCEVCTCSLPFEVLSLLVLGGLFGVESFL